MTRPIQDIEKKARETRNLSRRAVLGLMGSATASSLLGREASASAVEPSTQTQSTQTQSTQTQKKQTQKTNGRIVRIDARPAAITIDMAKTAAIVVDMQNDFGAKGGMFDLAGVDISGIRSAIAPAAEVLALARQAGVKMVRYA